MKIEYGEVKIALSREYPFGKALTVKELNGHDNVAINKQVEKGDAPLYVQIARSTGILYDETLMLADKDAVALSKALENF